MEPYGDGQKREIEGGKFAERKQDHVMAPLVRVEPSGISPRMFVAGFSFGGRLCEGVQQWQASMKVSLRVRSGRT